MALDDGPGTRTFTHMGGEGAPFVGLSSFTEMKHMFANLGDGTYQHSGSLAIRQAVAAKTRITYKLLFNDAVAMTGGQPAEGGPTVPHIAAQLAAEGVQRIAIVADEAERLPPASALPPGVTRHTRDELDAVQTALRDFEGPSVLIYDQVCATEKRRRRKRGSMAQPVRHVVINEAVCENCGDCSTQSGCIAIEPVETELGRKRRINPTSCNVDLSCLKGFCPSFVTAGGAAGGAGCGYALAGAGSGTGGGVAGAGRAGAGGLARAVRGDRRRRDRHLRRGPGDGGASGRPRGEDPGFHRAGAEERRGRGACADRGGGGGAGCGAHSAGQRRCDAGGRSGGRVPGGRAGAECPDRGGDRQSGSGGDGGLQAQRGAVDRCGAASADDRESRPTATGRCGCTACGWRSGCSAMRRR